MGILYASRCDGLKPKSICRSLISIPLILIQLSMRGVMPRRGCGVFLTPWFYLKNHLDITIASLTLVDPTVFIMVTVGHHDGSGRHRIQSSGGDCLCDYLFVITLCFSHVSCLSTVCVHCSQIRNYRSVFPLFPFPVPPLRGGNYGNRYCSGREHCSRNICVC